MAGSGLGFSGVGIGGGLLGGVKPASIPSITDLFNGFNRTTGDSFTGGPSVVADNTGALINVPANRMAIQGGRLSYNLAEGATLGAELVAPLQIITAGWFVTGPATVTGETSFTTSAGGGGVYKTGIVTIGKKYRLVLSGDVSAGNIELRDTVTNSMLLSAAGSVDTTVSQSGFAIRLSTTAVATSVNLSVKEIIPIWLPTAADGSQLWTSQSVRTRSGTVAKYDSTFLGFLNEPARTNKVTCRKHNPVDTTNVTKSGDAASVLSVVDDVAALTAAGLIGICTNGKVYKLDNSLGTAPANVDLAGQVGSINPTVLSVHAYVTAGTGRLTDNGEGTTTTISNTTPYQRWLKEYTPVSTARQLRIKAMANSVVYFILPGAEEGAFATSTIPGDTLAAVTRPATVYTRPTAGVLRANIQGIAVRVVPIGTGQTGVIWSTRVDANNHMQIRTTPTQVLFSKTAAGATTSAIVNYTHAAGTPFVVMAHQDPAGAMKIRVKQDGGAWTAYGTNASNVDMPVGTTYQEGGFNGGSQFVGNYPFIEFVQSSLAKMEGQI